ncbi:hypothetical protein D3C84_1061320 [compost metagenome]
MVVRHVHVEQVDLVVVALELAAGIEHQGAGVDMVGTGDGGGHGPGHQPDPVLPRPGGQLGLDGPLTQGLCPVQIALALAEQGKVFRQQHQQGALPGQRRQLGGNLCPVILPVTARDQLYGG